MHSWSPCGCHGVNQDSHPILFGCETLEGLWGEARRPHIVTTVRARTALGNANVQNIRVLRKTYVIGIDRLSIRSDQYTHSVTMVSALLVFVLSNYMLSLMLMKEENLRASSQP